MKQHPKDPAAADGRAHGKCLPENPRREDADAEAGADAEDSEEEADPGDEAIHAADVEDLAQEADPDAT